MLLLVYCIRINRVLLTESARLHTPPFLPAESWWDSWKKKSTNMQLNDNIIVVHEDLALILIEQRLIIIRMHLYSGEHILCFCTDKGSNV